MPDEPIPTEAEPVLDEDAFESGGDPVCWAHLVCPECGAITHTGHRAGCPLGDGAAARRP